MPNALAVLAISEAGGMLHAPDMYMEKIAIGPGYPVGTIDLDDTASKNVERLAKAKGVPLRELTACVLDRPRHENLIAELRSIGVGIRLIPDGDIAGVIWTTDPAQTGIDIYLGSGGAPEGVLAAAALSCIGGQMQGRLAPELHPENERAGLIERARSLMKITDMRRKYGMQDMVSGDVIFSASGVTDGSLMSGVHFRADFAETETVVMRARTGTVRRIKTTFRNVGVKMKGL